MHAKPAVAEAFIRQSLSTNKLFKSLSPSDCEVLVQAFQKVTFARGDAIIKQGDPGDKRCGRLKGQAASWTAPRPICLAGPSGGSWPA